MDRPIAITFMRELGSGGAYIAMQVARRLGYAYLDHQILHEAAKELGCHEEELEGRDERLQSFWDKLIAVFALGAPEGIYIPPPRWISDERLIETEKRLLRELASRGACVVVGRGAFYLLRGQANLFNVFIHAPVSFRIRRVMAKYELKDEKEAAEMIDRSDQERSRYIRFCTGLDRFDARNYHLAIDTGTTDFASASEMIVNRVGMLREEGDWPWVADPL
ncbi:MAG: cytidylate kinase-like family protein [Syntrophobacteraceae bacterium]|nr:cytidylate kinase-like family protein [Syntrophobacteraceae bacterium]